MERNLDNRIVWLLQVSPSHARALAATLDVNHMSVVRSLSRLAKANVATARMVGRSKVFALKRTIEARNAVLAAEISRLADFVSRRRDARRLIDQVAADGRIAMAVVFGSAAGGTEGPRSDFDLYVETSASVKELERLHPRLNVVTGSSDTSGHLWEEMRNTHVIIKGFEEFHERFGIPADDGQGRGSQEGET